MMSYHVIVVVSLSFVAFIALGAYEADCILNVVLVVSLKSFLGSNILSARTSDSR